MKKVLLLSIALILGVAVVTSCKKDSSEPTEEQLANALRTNWAKDELHGRPQKVLETVYDDNYLQWDSVANKPITPTRVSRFITTEYSGAGYTTRELYTTNVVIGANKLPDNRIVVTQSRQLPVSETLYTYDSHNRELTMVAKGYDYTTTYAGTSIPGYYKLHAGDTVPDSLARNSNPLVTQVDSAIFKYETAYDDAAKLATTVEYIFRNGEWVEVARTEKTLNQYGFVDVNSSMWRYVSVKATRRSNSVSYKENDNHGNWVLKYDYGYDMGAYYLLYNYNTRSIQYY